jgi:hypothetical protein
LEGLFREIYRKDEAANKLNRQKRHKPIQRVRVPEPRLKDWSNFGTL